MADILDSVNTVLDRVGQTGDKFTGVVQNLTKSLGFIDSSGNDGYNITVIRLVDPPLATHIYYNPEIKSDHNQNTTRTLVARKGEPITYTEARSTDLELNCYAEHGILIIVLPEEMDLQSKLKINRLDTGDNQLRVMAENGKINNQDKLVIKKNTTSAGPGSNGPGSNGPNGNGPGRVVLVKNDNSNWSTE